MGAVLGIGYWVGVIASIIAYYKRSGLGDIKSSQGIDWREFLIPSPAFFVLLIVKALAWPIVLIFWMMTGRPPSPWLAVTDRDGRPARAILRRSGAAPYDAFSAAAPRTPATPAFDSSAPALADPQNPVSAPARGGGAAPQPLTVPAPATPEPASASAATAANAPATSEEEMTKEMAFSLAAMCQEASRLYDQCVEKANDTEKARAVSQSDYVNGVAQHPISKKTFAEVADRMEKELIYLLRQLHDLAASGQSTWSDFMFLAGGPSSDISTAMRWCGEHGIDAKTVNTIAVQGLFLRCDFGLTKESFLRENDRLSAVLESNQQ